MTASPPKTGVQALWAYVLGGLLVLAFVIGVVMLVTDKNLQTNFGATSPYYIHWYGVLVLAVLSAIVGGALIASARSSMAASAVGRRQRGTVLLGFVWSVLCVVAIVGILAAYQQVGFSNISDWAKYLFGVTPYPGALSYIPWLYDLLLAVYIVAVIVGAIAVTRLRAASIAPSGNGASAP